MVQNHANIMEGLAFEKATLDLKIKEAESIIAEREEAFEKEVWTLKNQVKILNEKFGVISLKREISLQPRTNAERVDAVTKIYSFLRGLDRDTYQMVVASVNGMAPSDFLTS